MIRSEYFKPYKGLYIFCFRHIDKVAVATGVVDVVHNGVLARLTLEVFVDDHGQQNHAFGVLCLLCGHLQQLKRSRHGGR